MNNGDCINKTGTNRHAVYKLQESLLTVLFSMHSICIKTPSVLTESVKVQYTMPNELLTQSKLMFNSSVESEPSVNEETDISKKFQIDLQCSQDSVNGSLRSWVVRRSRAR